MLKNLAIGKAGELRVASELLLRGFEVSLTLVDSGSDLILNNGTRIQVKSARKSIARKTKKFTKYAFSFKSWKRTEGRYTPHPLDDVDYVILWAIEDDVFFIIPSAVIKGKYSISFSLSSKGWQSFYTAYKDNWESLNHRQERSDV